MALTKTRARKLSNKYRCSVKDRKMSREWYQQNKAKYNTWARKYSRTPSERYRNAKYECRAERNLSFNLSLKKYKKLLLQGCYYCHQNLMDKTGVGLDRINNQYGYSVKNVLPCCGDCNNGRGTRYTVDEWKIMINALLTYRKVNQKSLRYERTK